MNDYFLESVPNGIAHAVQSLLPETECSGQDGYELLVRTFGNDVSGAIFKNYAAHHCQLLADHIQNYFELTHPVTADTARTIIESALVQWDG